MKKLLLALMLLGVPVRAQISSGGGCPGTCAPVISGSVSTHNTNADAHSTKFSAVGLSTNTLNTLIGTKENAGVAASSINALGLAVGIATQAVADARVPYTGATGQVDLGAWNIKAASATLTYGISAATGVFSGLVQSSNVIVNGFTTGVAGEAVTFGGAYPYFRIMPTGQRGIGWSTNWATASDWAMWQATSADGDPRGQVTRRMAGNAAGSLLLQPDGGDTIVGGALSAGPLTVSSATVNGNMEGPPAAPFDIDSPGGPLYLNARNGQVVDIGYGGGNTVVWHNLGVNTTAPGAKLDVNGDTAFRGASTMVGSMTVTGAMQVSGSTLTVAASGIITAPSQPYAVLTDAAGQYLSNGGAVSQPYFWAAATVNQGMWAVTSSGNITVPAAGLYALEFSINPATDAGCAYSLGQVFVDGTEVCRGPWLQRNAQNFLTIQASCKQYLTAGQVVSFRYLKDGNTGPTNAGAGLNYASVVKLW